MKTRAYLVAVPIAIAVLAGCGHSQADGIAFVDGTDGGAQCNDAAINEYIARILPHLQDSGFPDVTMRPIREGETWKILVTGTVRATSKRSREDNQEFLETALPLTQPPAEIIMQVNYRRRFL